MLRNSNKSDWSGGLPACIASFSVIEDPRTGGNKLHHFGEVLFMAVSAMLCGMNCFSDIEDFCDLQIDRLRKWIKMHIGALHPALKRQIGALRRIVLNLLKIDLTDTRSLRKKRRRAMLDLTYRDSLLSLA
ncbi:MAG: transposase family protein [Verrucomicrobiaceae bacterium]|jgi:hypothetical protein|nr:MAG: transposase family protein [Verrucomicrobiaceae bacterium]